MKLVMMPSSQCLVLLLLFSISALHRSVCSEPYEKQLNDHLFKNYNLMVRPIEDPNEPLIVNIMMFIKEIKDVNEKDGTITVGEWIDMRWNDSGLCWDPAQFGNATTFVHPADQVWLPDTAMNSAVGARLFHSKHLFVVIDHSCMVEYAPGAVSTHTCDFDAKVFPFDTQTCNFQVSTWFSPARYIQLVTQRLLYDTKKRNGIWEIIGNRSYISYSNSNAPMEIVFTLTMKRKPLYYIIYVIIPLLMLAFLNVMVFRVPPDSGEKLSLSVTILLAFAIWLTMLNDLTPRSSDSIPIIGMFVTVLMLLSAVSTTVSVHIVRIYHFDDSYPVPSWVGRITRVYALDGNSATKNDKDENPSETLTWQLVALALDQIAFIVMVLMTVTAIFGSIIAIVIHKANDSN